MASRTGLPIRRPNPPRATEAQSDTAGGTPPKEFR